MTKSWNVSNLFIPGAIISHPRRDALVIDTNISGEVSTELCRQLFNSFASRPEFKDLEWRFAIAQYSMLGIALSDNVIIWDKSKKDYFWVLKKYQLEEPSILSRIPPFVIDRTNAASSLQQNYSQVRDPREELAKAVLGTVAGVISKKVQNKETSPPPPATEPKPTTTTSADATTQHKATVICGDSVVPVPITSDSTAARKTLNCGEQVTILSRTGAWARIKTSDGIEGYIAISNA